MRDLGRRWLGILGLAWFGLSVDGMWRLVAAEPEVVREAMALGPVGRAGRNTLFTDALEAEVVAGRWKVPQLGAAVVSARDGSARVWTQVVANAEGWFTGPEMRGGWLYSRLESDRPRTRMLQITGHSMAYVNGEPRAGDIYGYGYVTVPVALRPGVNDVLVAAGRGRVKVSWTEPDADVFLQAADSTLPDAVIGERLDAWAAVVLVNATTNWLQHARVTAVVEGRSTDTETGSIPPLGVRKVGFRVRAGAAKAEGRLPMRVRVRVQGGEVRVGAPLAMELRVRKPTEVRKETFVSSIDGSVQYYAVNPSRSGHPGGGEALFLSLHGASVEGLGQAEAYGGKRWGTLVAPTNRRPYGFDWEEWGRMDALEVLDLAISRFKPDLSRIHLTGHSMGGHGTWNLGLTFPSRFAAIGPSAGWISFFSYAGTDPFTNATPVEAMLRRGAASSDTLAMATNALQLGVYIVHGDADDNVPVREARRMREVLGGFHRDFSWHEQPGAGHWWETSDEPGAECVDWPPMFDFFAKRRIPKTEEVRQIRFVTVNPGVSSRSHWVTVEAQEHSQQPSEVSATWDPGAQRIMATTRNVARLSLDLGALGPSRGGYRIELDGTRFEGLQPGVAGRGIEGLGGMKLERRDGAWRVAERVSPWEKGPHRAGPFKDAFRHRMLFVYGTTGTAEENAWALAKARFDAEAFWYRGNGSVDVVADTSFEPSRFPDRGVVLYGHADMNAAWGHLLAGSPVKVRRGEVTVGSRRVSRDDVACLFLQPRPDSDVASVAVVAGSGMAGLRMTNRLPYFMSGTGYPDCLVIGADALTRGTAGIVGAGFFGNDWSVERGEFAWAEDGP